MEALPVLRPRILESYVAREFSKIMALTLAAFLSVFLLVDFFERIDRLVKAGLGLMDFSQYVLLKIPFALAQVLPPAALLAALLTFGLLSRANETLAVRTSGIDVLGLTRPILLLSGVLGVLMLALNLYLVPWSQGELSFFWETQVMKKPARSLIGPEHFWYKGDRAIYNIVMFHKETQVLEGVTMYLFNDHFQLTQVITSKQARWQGDRWHFHQGTIHSLGEVGTETWESFEERDFLLTERPADFGSLEKRVTEMNSSELYRYVRRLERDGYKSTPYRVEFQSRLALALTPVILALLGLGLVLRREGYYLPALVAVALGLMFIYWLGVGLSTSLGQAGRWPAALAVWWPHLFVGLVGGVLLRKASR